MIVAKPAAFLKPWGIQVEQKVSGSEDTRTALGILTHPGRELDFAGVRIVTEDITLLYATDELDIAAGTNLTADGQPYQARESILIGDGLFSRATLKRTAI